VRRASRREKMRRRRIWGSWSLKMIQLQRQRMLQKCSLRSAIALSRGCVLTQTTLSPSSQDALKYHGQPVRAERHNSLWDHAWHADLASDISIAHSRV